MTKWTPIVSDGKTPPPSDLDTENYDFGDEDDDFSNQTQDDDEDDVDVTDLNDDADFDDNESDDDADAGESEPPKKQNAEKTKAPEKPSRSEQRIRELVAKQKELEAQLERERQEKLAFKKQNRASEASSIDSEISKLETNMGSIEEKMKRAMEEQDTENFLKLQKELTASQVELMVAKTAKSRLAAEDSEPEQDRRSSQREATQNQRPQLPKPLLDWKKRNDWFEKDRARTGMALGINAELLEEGYDPTSAEFYEEIDSRMSAILGTSRKQPEGATPTKKKILPVGESSKASPPASVQVTSKDRAFAKKMGIDPKEYLRQKAAYEAQKSSSGRSFKPIFTDKN